MNLFISHREIFPQLAAEAVDSLEYTPWKTPNHQYSYTDNDRKVDKFFKQSGWANKIGEINSQLIILDNNSFRRSILPMPVFYGGNYYRCFLGKENSYAACTLMNLKHSAIPFHVKIVAGGNVHYLLEPMDGLIPFGEYIEAGFYSEVMDRLFDELIDFVNLATYYRFYFNVESRAYVKTTESGVSLVILPDQSVIRYSVNTSWVNGHLICEALDLLLKWKRSIKKSSSRRFRLKFDPKKFEGKDLLPPDYKLEEATYTILDDYLLTDHSMHQFFENLEMLMALASKGIPVDPYNIREQFLRNLNIFGYMRPSIYIYMTDREAIKYLNDILKDPSILKNYQATYNQYASNWRDSRPEYGSEINHIGYQEPLSSFGEVEIFTRTEVGSFIPSAEYSPIESKSIKINDYKFNTNELAFAFRSTPLEQIAKLANESDDLKVSWLAPEDCKLISDMLSGKIMYFIMYRDLSDQAYNNLSFEGSLLYAYNSLEFRKTIDFNFQFDKKFIDQNG